MKTNDIRRIIDTGLANVTTTPQDVDAVMNHILSGSARKKAPVRKARVVIAALAAVMITLLLSVIAQALGIPVWDVFVIGTDNNVKINVDRDDRFTTEAQNHISGFSSDEIAAWGEETCNIFDEIGIYPDLPSYVPEGFVLTDPITYVDGFGYICVDLLYENADGKTFTFVSDIYQAGRYSYSLSVEFDYREYRSFNLQGVDYVIGSNLSINSAAWFDKKGCYTISGDLSIDELEKMVRSIERDFDSVITPDDLKSGANE